jgi:GNAT superfamily N-acetyltransferase
MEATDFAEKLRGFLASTVPNAWIVGHEYEVYVRKGYHILDGRSTRHTLDIANIVVKEPARGWGVASSILDTATRLNPREAVYIENIMNLGWGEHLVSQGWLVVPRAVPLCLYKMKSHT